MAKEKQKRKNDVILCVIIILTALAIMLFINFTKTDGDKVIVLIDGKETASYLLSENLTTVIETGEGNKNILVIDNGKAYVKEASCPDKVCVEHKPISQSGETIVCLPHKVVVQVVSENSDVDIAV